MDITELNLPEDKMKEIMADPAKYKYFMNLLEKTKAEKKLIDFVKLQWTVLHGDNVNDAFKHNWSIEALCEHLEWAYDGQIQKLAIEIPPRMSKPVYQEEYVLTNKGYIKLKNIKVGDFVLSHTGKYNKVLEVHEQGLLPTRKIETNNGSEIITAHDHPILTNSGWKEAKDIKADFDRLISTPPEEIENNYFDTLSGDRDNSHVFLYILLNNINPKYINKIHTKNAKTQLNNLGYKNVNINTSLEKFIQSKGYQFVTEDNLINMLNRTSDSIISELIRILFKNIGKAYSKLNQDGKRINYLNFRFTDIRHINIFRMALFRLGIYSKVKKTRSVLKEYYDYELNLVIDNDIDIVNILKTSQVMIPSEFIENIDGHISGVMNENQDDNRCIEETVKSNVLNEKLECRCLTVENDHSFVVKNIAVHNSIITSAMFPAWIWGPKNDPVRSFIYAAHSLKNTWNNVQRTSMLLNGETYQKNWGKNFELVADSQKEIKNSKNGRVETTGIGSGTTGMTSHINIADDLLDAQDSNSPAALQKAWDFYSGSFMNRLADQGTGINIIIAQRLHPRDPLGMIRQQGLDFVFLTLPMEFIPEKRCYTINNWRDPRVRPGELLFKERFDEKFIIEEKKKFKGTNTYACQYLQDPEISENVIFDVGWFNKIAPLDKKKFKKIVRSWDLAGSVGPRNDWTVGALVAMDHDDMFYILDIERFQAEPPERNKRMKAVAVKDGPAVNITIPQDPASGGKETALYIQKILNPYKSHLALQRNFKTSTNTGKIAKQEILSSVAADKGIYVFLDVGNKKWNELLFDEFEKIPNGKHDDQVDAVYDGYNFLNGDKTNNNRILKIYG